MGQCWVKLNAAGDLTVANVTESYHEGAAYRFHNGDGPVSQQEQAIHELLGPLFRLALEARFGQQLCLHVLGTLTRVARLCLTDRSDGPPSAARLARLRELAWDVEELLDGFSSRGWVLRLFCTTRLDALVKWRLDDLKDLADELAQNVAPALEPPRGPGTPGHRSTGGVSLASTGKSVVEADGSKQLAAGLMSAKRLQEALVVHLPSVMASHGGAGDPSAMDAFMRRITPLLQRGDDPLRQLELHEEVQITVASLSVGPHRALRHPDLQYFWWRHMAGLEEVPWSTLWPHLVTFLRNTPRLSDGAGDTGVTLELLQSPQTVRRLQAAVHRMGYSNYVNAVELDMAFGPGTGTGECTTLDEQLTVLLAPGRPALLARTSKGALAEGWRRDAAEAAAAKQRAMEAMEGVAAASEALEGSASEALEGAASEALEGEASEALDGGVAEASEALEGGVASEAPYSPFIIGSSTRKVLAAAAAEVTSPAVRSPSSPGAGASSGAAPGPVSPATAAASLEEDMWFDAGSNVSRSNSSGLMSMLAGGRDGSGIWPGRVNVSQVMLLAGSEESPRSGALQARRNNTTNPSLAASMEAAGSRLDPQAVSWRPSVQLRRHWAVSVGGVAGAGTVKDTTVDAANIPDQDHIAAGDNSIPSAVAAAQEPGHARRRSPAPEEEIEPAEPRIETTAQAPAGQRHQPDPGQQQEHQEQVLQLGQRRPSATVRHSAILPDPPWPEVTPSLTRLIGREQDISRLVQGVQSRSATGGDLVSNNNKNMLKRSRFSRQAPSARSDVATTNGTVGVTAGSPVVLVLTGPAGCGRTALATAAADQLLAMRVWTSAAFTDLRCASGPEEAALEMALALNVPFYAADRPAGARLLSWLRTYGPQLRQGLVLDNVELLMGIGKDDALEVARGTTGTGLTSGGVSTTTTCPSQPAAGCSAAPTADACPTQPAQPVPLLAASLAEGEDRRRRALRLLRDVVLAAPGLQLVMISGPEVTQELLQPCMPQDLSIRFQPLGLISEEAARQVLRRGLALHGTDVLSKEEAAMLDSQIRAIVQAANHLPGLLRLAARAVRCETQDLAGLARWATDALNCAEGKSADASTAAFAAQLISHSLTLLPPDARAVLNCLVNMGCPLEEEDVTVAAAFLGHPGIVRAGLCCLYDRGLLTFQDLSRRHDVVGHVRRWMIQCCTFMLRPAMNGASMAGNGSSPGAARNASSTPRSTAGGGAATAATAAAVPKALMERRAETHISGAGGDGRGSAPLAVVSEEPGDRNGEGGGAAHSQQIATSEHQTSFTGVGRRARGRHGNAGRHDGHMREEGIRLSVLVQHVDSLLSQVGELYAHGCRVAALRVYNNSRALADRALLLVPAWISQTAPSSATAAFFAAVMNRHLNNICRHVLLPGQLARVSQDLANMIAWLPSPHDRLAAYATAARAHVHLMDLKPAARHLAAADLLAQQLYSALDALLTSNKQQASQTRAKTTGGGVSGGSAAAAGANGRNGRRSTPRLVSASLGGGREQAKEREVQKLHLTAVPPQVAQLVLAHAELAAAHKQYDIATRHLETFLELLAAAGTAQSLESAQAHMQLGDLCVIRNRPSAEAAAQYELAANLLMQLYGQSHFRVGRGLLAAARCCAENSQQLGTGEAQSPLLQPLPLPPDAAPGSGGKRRGSWRDDTEESHHPQKATRPLEVQLQDCLFVQQLSQGKFNLDVAEVEVARGSLMCRRNQPEEALSCGLKALGIVLEILGDGTPQVAECLALVAQALRQKKKAEAAAAILEHAQAVREHATVVAVASCDASSAAAAVRPRPTREVLLECLADATPQQLLCSHRSPLVGTATTTAAAPAPTASATIAATTAAASDTGGRLSQTPTRTSGREASASQRSRCMSGASSKSHSQHLQRSLPGSALLLRSPVVQVPLPDGSNDELEHISSRSCPTPGASQSLLPSPQLVVLVPGDGFGADDMDGGNRSENLNSVNARHVPPSMESPSKVVCHWDLIHGEAVTIDAVGASSGSSRGGSSGGASSGVRVTHLVPYPPPQAPVDSAPVGYDEASPLSHASVLDAEWPPTSVATTPPSPLDHFGDAVGLMTVVSQTGTAAATADASSVALSLPAMVTAAAAVARPAGDAEYSEGTAVASPAHRLDSTVPSEMWADAPEEFPDAAGGDVDGNVQVGGTAGAVLHTVEADADIASRPPLPAVAAVLALIPDPSECLVMAALLPPSAAAAVASEDLDEALLSSRTAASPSGMAMRLPLPRPVSSLEISTVASSISNGTATAAATEPWSTPVRARLAELSIPHLHTSPLTEPAPRYSTLTNENLSTSPQPFSPGLSLPQPPLISTTGPSHGTSGSFETSVILMAATLAAANIISSNPGTTTSTTTAFPGSDGTPDTATPLAQLSWSAYSPTAARHEQDARTLRGGLVHTTPSTTPGQSLQVSTHCPWLTWAAGDHGVEVPRKVPWRRELQFSNTGNTGNMSKSSIIAGGTESKSSIIAVIPGNEAVAGVVAPMSEGVAADRSAAQLSPRGGGGDGGSTSEVSANGTVAEAAAVQTSTPTRSRALRIPHAETQPVTLEQQDEEKHVQYDKQGHVRNMAFGQEEVKKAANEGLQDCGCGQTPANVNVRITPSQLPSLASPGKLSVTVSDSALTWEGHNDQVVGEEEVGAVEAAMSGVAAGLDAERSELRVPADVAVSCALASDVPSLGNPGMGLRSCEKSVFAGRSSVAEQLVSGLVERAAAERPDVPSVDARVDGCIDFVASCTLAFSSDIRSTAAAGADSSCSQASAAPPPPPQQQQQPCTSPDTLDDDAAGATYFEGEGGFALGEAEGDSSPVSTSAAHSEAAIAATSASAVAERKLRAHRAEVDSSPITTAEIQPAAEQVGLTTGGSLVGSSSSSSSRSSSSIFLADDAASFEKNTGSCTALGVVNKAVALHGEEDLVSEPQGQDCGDPYNQSHDAGMDLRSCSSHCSGQGEGDSEASEVALPEPLQPWTASVSVGSCAVPVEERVVLMEREAGLTSAAPCTPERQSHTIGRIQLLSADEAASAVSAHIVVDGEVEDRKEELPLATLRNVDAAEVATDDPWSRQPPAATENEEVGNGSGRRVVNRKDGSPSHDTKDVASRDGACAQFDAAVCTSPSTSPSTSTDVAVVATATTAAMVTEMPKVPVLRYGIDGLIDSARLLGAMFQAVDNVAATGDATADATHTVHLDQPCEALDPIETSPGGMTWDAASETRDPPSAAATDAGEAQLTTLCTPSDADQLKLDVQVSVESDLSTMDERTGVAVSVAGVVCDVALRAEVLSDPTLHIDQCSSMGIPPLGLTLPSLSSGTARSSVMCGGLVLSTACAAYNAVGVNTALAVGNEAAATMLPQIGEQDPFASGAVKALGDAQVPLLMPAPEAAASMLAQAKPPSRGHAAAVAVTVAGVPDGEPSMAADKESNSSSAAFGSPSLQEDVSSSHLDSRMVNQECAEALADRQPTVASSSLALESESDAKIVVAAVAVVVTTSVAATAVAVVITSAGVGAMEPVAVELPLRQQLSSCEASMQTRAPYVTTVTSSANVAAHSGGSSGDGSSLTSTLGPHVHSVEVAMAMHERLDTSMPCQPPSDVSGHAGASDELDPMTPLAPVRMSGLGSVAANAGSVAVSVSGRDTETSGKKPVGWTGCRIPLPPSSTGSSHHTSRSGSRIPTPPQSSSVSHTSAATMTPTPPQAAVLLRPQPRPLASAAFAPMAGSASGGGGGASSAQGTRDLAAAATWTLYSSPAYGIPEASISPPRCDTDTTTAATHDSTVSSPAARYAGSYTAVYLMRAKAKSAAMAALGTRDCAETADGGGGDVSGVCHLAKQSSADAGMLAASTTTSLNPCDPRDSVKMHNPLFISGNGSQSGGIDVTRSSTVVERDDEYGGLTLHSVGIFGSIGESTTNFRGASEGGNGNCRDLTIHESSHVSNGGHGGVRGRSTSVSGSAVTANRGGGRSSSGGGKAGRWSRTSGNASCASSTNTTRGRSASGSGMAGGGGSWVSGNASSVSVADITRGQSSSSMGPSSSSRLHSGSAGPTAGAGAGAGVVSSELVSGGRVNSVSGETTVHTTDTNSNNNGGGSLYKARPSWFGGTNASNSSSHRHRRRNSSTAGAATAVGRVARSVGEMAASDANTAVTRAARVIWLGSGTSNGSRRWSSDSSGMGRLGDAAGRIGNRDGRGTNTATAAGPDPYLFSNRRTQLETRSQALSYSRLHIRTQTSTGSASQKGQPPLPPRQEGSCSNSNDQNSSLLLRHGSSGRRGSYVSSRSSSVGGGVRSERKTGAKEQREENG